MAQLLNLSVNLSAIDKSKLIEGKKGKYLNLTVSVNDEKDQFDNDVSCWQGQSQEERQGGVKRTYLGNGRKVWEGSQKTTAQAQAFPSQAAADEDEDLPF